MPTSRTRRPHMRQDLRHGTARPLFRTNADDVACQVLLHERQDRPDTRTRQDLRDDKIGTDQGGSDVTPTPTKFFFSDATRLTSVFRDRSRRAILPSNPETRPRTPRSPNSPNPKVIPYP